MVNDRNPMKGDIVADQNMINSARRLPARVGGEFICDGVQVQPFERTLLKKPFALLIQVSHDDDFSRISEHINQIADLAELRLLTQSQVSNCDYQRVFGVTVTQNHHAPAR